MRRHSVASFLALSVVCTALRVVCMALVLPATGNAQGSPAGAGSSRATSAGVVLAEAVPNDNRVAGGRAVDGAVRLHLAARVAAWRPDLDVDSTVTVQAFAESGSEPRIPGPLLRTFEGGVVHIDVTNDIPDSTLVVHGLRAGTVADDTIVVRSGERRTITFSAGAPGTYLYWGTTSGMSTPAERNGRDSQLTGAIVIDPVGTVPDPAERIFVMTVIDILPDSTQPPPHEDIWELAINGRSWPHSERLEYELGDRVRWRWLNGTYLPHPMHLHGFHFRVVAKGNGISDTRYADDHVRDVVTEFMAPGSTFAMEWTPTRPGNWLFHCHMAPHITPFPARADSAQTHDTHDVAQHALQGMAGLVLGIHTTAPAASRLVSNVEPATHLRLIAQQGLPAEQPLLRTSGYVLDNGVEPRADSVTIPAPTLVLSRGQTTAITVVNRTDELTTVHWHGMELESIYDGVAGWSGIGSNLAPLVAPGDSFTVSFTPPRAGTFIYHTHMDEGTQLMTGSYGPLIVLEPGEIFDPETDLVFVAGRAVNGSTNVHAINGSSDPAPRDLRTGVTYRLRVINIMPAEGVDVQLVADSVIQPWTPIAKDGASLPRALQVEQPGLAGRIGVGETYDFLWTPDRPMDAVLVAGNPNDGFEIRQVLRVR